MSSQKDSIKKWLKKNNHNRAWLAEQCGVSKRTVDDWLSTSRQIPAKAILVIQKLMGTNIQQTEEPSLDKQAQRQILHQGIMSHLEDMMRQTEAELFHDYTVEELAKARDTAKKQGITPKEYLIISFLHHAAQFMDNSSKNDNIYDHLEKEKNSRNQKK